MKTVKSDWLIWIMLAVPFVFIAAFWDKFPDQIATHFDMEGNPNDYSGKAFGLFFLPAVNIGLYFLFLLLPKIDPRRANYALFSDKYRIIRIILHAFMMAVFFISAFYALGYILNTSLYILYGMLLLFLVLGNYMGNIRPNYFVGIRVPWTLASEEVWVRTHRLTGKLWVFGTLIMMVLIPFLPSQETFMGIYLGIITLVPIIYSYVLYKKLNANG